MSGARLLRKTRAGTRVDRPIGGGCRGDRRSQANRGAGAAEIARYANKGAALPHNSTVQGTASP